MPPTSTLPESPTRPPRQRNTRLVGIVAAAAAAAIFLQLAVILESPDVVERITVENPTDYDVSVDLVLDDGNLLGIGIVPTERTRTYASVLDPGDEFVFELDYGGVDAGEVVIDREALEQSDWTVTIPVDAEATLADEGLDPSPG